MATIYVVGLPSLDWLGWTQRASHRAGRCHGLDYDLKRTIQLVFFRLIPYIQAGSPTRGEPVNIRVTNPTNADCAGADK